MNILIFDWNSVLTDVKIELERRGHTLLPLDGTLATAESCDRVILWQETGHAGWRDFILRLQELGKKVILVQHGRRGTSRIYPPFNESLVSNLVCSWSENDKKRLMSIGTPENRIRVTGTAIWKHLKPRMAHEGKNVVFSPEHWDKDVTENFIVADKLRELKGVNVITKILTGHQDPAMYDNPVVSDRNKPDHLDIVMDTLSKADLVVAISESTFELIAQALDIPVVIADIWIPKACDGDARYKDYFREYSNACTKVSLQDLNKEIMNQLKHPEILRKERAEIVEADGGFSLPDPVKAIVDIIEEK